MPTRTEVLREARRYERLRRGFDAPDTAFPHFSVPSIGPDDPGLSRPAGSDDIRGSFAAIESLAGWWARTMPHDPTNPILVETAAVIAEELEQAARGLRVALQALQEGNE